MQNIIPAIYGPIIELDPITLDGKNWKLHDKGNYYTQSFRTSALDSNSLFFVDLQHSKINSESETVGEDVARVLLEKEQWALIDRVESKDYDDNEENNSPNLIFYCYDNEPNKDCTLTVIIRVSTLKKISDTEIKQITDIVVEPGSGDEGNQGQTGEEPVPSEPAE